MFNKVVLVGNLTKDIELRYLPSGTAAEVANQYLKKGSQVLIEGRLVLESWTDNTGVKRTKHSITAESMQMLGQPQKTQEQDKETQNASTPLGEGEEIPF